METEVPRTLRCLAGLALAVWIASVFGEPSYATPSGLALVLLGSSLIGLSCALFLSRRPEKVRLPSREASAAGG